MKNKKLLVLTLSAMILSACSNGGNPGTHGGGTGYDNGLGEAPKYDGPSISVHYHREDGAYTNKWALWLWEQGGEGAEYTFNGIDSFGAVAAYELSNWENVMTKGLGLIIRTAGSWSKQTPDMKIDLNDYTMDSNQIYHLYFEQGDEPIYDGNIYTSTNTEGISIAEFKTEQSVRIKGSKPMSKVAVFEDGVKIAEKTINPTNKEALVDLGTKKASFEHTYKVEVTFESGNVAEKGVSLNALYDTEAFTSNYSYRGSLGAIYSPTSTTFRVWSPVSSSVKLRLYQCGTPIGVDETIGNDNFTEIPMTRGEKGTWEVEVRDNLEKVYYTYVVTNAQFQDTEIVDPYAKSAGVNGLRGQVVNFNSSDLTDGEWDSLVTPHFDRKSMVVYETHVADVTSGANWTGPADKAKLYSGLIHEGTTLTYGGKTVKTGFDHIVELGPTSVQLLPIFDQANDETTKVFNWGYNPLNYNVVEGIYSSNPYDGYVRIKELRDVVTAFSKKGMNIIMDVVYNHVNGASGSNFDVLMPGYYFRYTNDGSLSNGSGCGNETASERPMMRKFMIDSVAHWAKEYKLGGFRFDLMGLHDVETMNQLVANVKSTVNPNIVIYGEPWAGGTSAMPNYEANSAKQSNGNKYVGYGQFNDQMRDALIKGGLNGASAKGWITNKANINNSDVTAIKFGIVGTTYSTQYSIADPNKTVNYVTCHDNYTLLDRIEAAAASDTDRETQQMAILAESVVMTSNGTSFMLSGDEFLRSKGGNSNSYNADYKVNSLKYNDKAKHLDVFETFKKIINFKKTATGLNVDNPTYTVEATNSGATIQYTFTQGGKTYFVSHTNGVQGGKAPVNLDGYTVVLDTANTYEDGATINGMYTPIAYQTLIACK